MNAQNMNQWLSLLANAGVVVGIFFLVIEVRQNDQILLEDLQLREATAFAQIEEKFIERSEQIASYPHIAELYARLSERSPKFSRAEMVILSNTIQPESRIIHIAYRYWKAGHLPASAWRKIEELVEEIVDSSQEPNNLFAKLEMRSLVRMPYDFLEHFNISASPGDHLNISSFRE